MKKRLIVYIVLIVLTSTCPTIILGQITDEEDLHIPPYAEPIDFNLDGKMDLFYVDDGMGTLYNWNGLNASIRQQRNIGSKTSFSFGYINEDGFPDILLSTDSKISYLPNENGYMGQEITIGTKALHEPKIWEAASYDLDGDGDEDIVYYSAGFEVRIVENLEGTFDFENRIKILDLANVDGNCRINFCDYNQDGLMDMVLFQVYNGLHVAINQGNFVFSDKQLANDWNNTQDFTVNDFNADSYPDFAVITRSSNPDPSGHLKVYMNPIDGCCPLVYTLNGFYEQNAIISIDVDQDLIPEILVADEQSISLINFEDGVFQREEIWGVVDSIGFTLSTTLKCGDYDQDGKLEFIHDAFLGNSHLLHSDYIKSTIPPYVCSHKSSVTDCPIGDIEISNQQELIEFRNSFPFCTVLNGSLVIKDSVTSLMPIDHITNINGSLLIENTMLEELSLSSLKAIQGNVSILNNPHLITLLGLENIRDIYGSLIVAQNSNLIDINALQFIHPELMDSLAILQNENLEACHILSVCTYLGQDRPHFILDNAMGCLNDTIVKLSCGINTSTSNTDPTQPAVIFPVPAQSDIYVSMDNQIDSKSTFRIINSLGQFFVPGYMVELESGERKFDISNLPPGLYFFQIKQNGCSTILKFVKE